MWPTFEVVYAVTGGFDTPPASTKQFAWKSAYSDLFPELKLEVGTGGYDYNEQIARRYPLPAAPVEVYPSVLAATYGWDQQVITPSFRAVYQTADFYVSTPFVLKEWGWELPGPSPKSKRLETAGLIEVVSSLLPFPWTADERSVSNQVRRYRLPEVFSSIPATLVEWGWESDGRLFRPQLARASSSIEVVSSLLTEWGWEPSDTHFRSQSTRIPTDLEVVATLLTEWGWEADSALFKPRLARASGSIEVVSSLLPGSWVDDRYSDRFWRGHSSFQPDDVIPGVEEQLLLWLDASTERRGSVRIATNEDVFPPSTSVFPWSGEQSDLKLYRLLSAKVQGYDVFVPLTPQGISPWVADLNQQLAKLKVKPNGLIDGWWPPIIQPNPLLPGGGYKPSSIFEGRKEDLDFINRVEQTIEAIDGELAALADEPTVTDSSSYQIAEPDVLPPGWRSGREREPRPEQERVRHVHYNFSSDLDFGVRRRIVAILDRAEHRGANILGSDAFLTSETARVHGQLVTRGTNAWVLKLAGDARLELAKEAITEGFRLISFDDTSLSFIHRPTYPWKQLYLGAGIGAGLMGAGVGLGYLIWGRKPNITPSRPIRSSSKPTPKSLPKSTSKKK